MTTWVCPTMRRLPRWIWGRSCGIALFAAIQSCRTDLPCEPAVTPDGHFWPAPCVISLAGRAWTATSRDGLAVLPLTSSRCRAVQRLEQGRDALNAPSGRARWHQGPDRSSKTGHAARQLRAAAPGRTAHRRAARDIVAALQLSLAPTSGRGRCEEDTPARDDPRRSDQLVRADAPSFNSTSAARYRSPSSASVTGSEMWIRPGSAEVSRRLATFTVSPQTS